MNVKRTLATIAAAASIAFTPATADAHYVNGRSKVIGSNVNGLCGIGSFTCYRSTISIRYLYSGADHWRVYEVEYYEIKPWLGPWGTRKCHVNKVWTYHTEAIGSPTRADYCYK